MAFSRLRGNGIVHAAPSRPGSALPFAPRDSGGISIFVTDRRRAMLSTRWNWQKLFSYGEVICFVSAWAVDAVDGRIGAATGRRSRRHADFAISTDVTGMQATSRASGMATAAAHRASIVYGTARGQSVAAGSRAVPVTTASAHSPPRAGRLCIGCVPLDRFSLPTRLLGRIRHFVAQVGRMATPQVELDRHFGEAELVAELAQQVALVRLRDSARVVAEQHDRRRLDADLRARSKSSAADCCATAAGFCRTRLAQHAIELAGRDAGPRLLEQHLRRGSTAP